MSAAQTCPCCGTSLGLVDGVRWDMALRLLETRYGGCTLSKRQAAAFDLIWKSRPHPVAAERFAPEVWPDIDGGPLALSVHVSNVVRHLRRKCGPLGIAIVSKTGRGDGYRLAIATPDAALAVHRAISARFDKRTARIRFRKAATAAATEGDCNGV